MTRARVLSAAVLCFLTIVAGTWCAVAQADALPAATGFVECTSANGYIDDAAACATAFDSATRSLSPFASLTTTAAYPGGFAAVNAGAIGFLNYSFEVVGGSPGDSVPIDIDTTLQAVPFGGGYAFSEIGVYTPGLAAYAVICSSGCADNAISFSATLHANAQVGVVDTVSLEVEASGGFSATANGGFASADPYIHVDPGFAGASLYSIVQSAGVGNGTAAAVPEPASVALMAAGIAALLGLRRRQSFSRRPPAPRRAPC